VTQAEPPATKVCRDCQASLPLDEFPPNKKTRDGRASYCRPCTAVRHRTSRDRKRGAPPSRVHEPLPVGQRDAKWCAACQQQKPLTAFGRNRSRPDGLTSYCQPCHNAKSLEAHVRNSGSSRDHHLERRYGTTGAQVDALVVAQGGLCRERVLQHVDHDHSSRAVRGVLCSGCNQGLGNFRDSAASLRAAAYYVERTTVQRRRVDTGVFSVRRPVPASRAPANDLGPLLAARRCR
jgi:Recombination endonuclease VII